MLGASPLLLSNIEIALVYKENTTDRPRLICLLLIIQLFVLLLRCPAFRFSVLNTFTVSLPCLLLWCPNSQPQLFLASLHINVCIFLFGTFTVSACHVYTVGLQGHDVISKLISRVKWSGPIKSRVLNIKND